jgi:hypothetical protein
MKTDLKKGKSAIYSAILKHGISNFKLEILEYCEPEECIGLEQKYINLLQPSYNILKIAGSLLGFKHSEKTLNQLREIAKCRSEEYRAKMSASMRAWAKKSPKSQKIQVTDLELDTKTTFHSISEAARALNINQRTISNYFIRNQKKPYKGRYLFTIQI